MFEKNINKINYPFALAITNSWIVLTKLCHIHTRMHSGPIFLISIAVKPPPSQLLETCLKTKIVVVRNECVIMKKLDCSNCK